MIAGLAKRSGEPPVRNRDPADPIGFIEIREVPQCSVIHPQAPLALPLGWSGERGPSPAKDLVRFGLVPLLEPRSRRLVRLEPHFS